MRVLSVAPRCKARYDKCMADQNGKPPEDLAAGRSFVPLNRDDLFSPKPEPAKDAAKKKIRPRGMPKARVNPEIAREFANEVNTKVTTGRSRMRWFANHLILFVVAIVTAVGLHMTIYQDIELAYFQIGLVGWVGVLAMHAWYAMRPLLRRSEKESQLKAVIPETDQNGENG